LSRHIPYSRQFIDEDDIKAVVDVLRSDFITQGPKVGKFEQALASYCGAKYAVAFSSGTAALHGAYFSVGISHGDEIITSPMTFVATSNAALYLGARPVFVDVEPDTGNIDSSLIEKAITKKTKAIVPVHYAGHPADIDVVHETAKKHNLIIIEDACHALGASYKGKKIGSLSDMTVFSFHPVKSITTGEGGAVLTNNADYYERLLMFRAHGITKENFSAEPHGQWYYEMQHLGFNYRLTDIQAALGASQLRKLDGFVQRRRQIAAAYDNAFRDNRFFDVPPERDYATSSYHLYPTRLKKVYKGKKRELFSMLRQNGLGVQIHYMPVYMQPYYQGLGYERGSCPFAEDFYLGEVSLPVYTAMSNEDVGHVIETVFSLFKES
jgi:UDP-4-amino-4,6-dideoxy-N-acetyl-beta-L-altrosamine transaminase